MEGEIDSEMLLDALREERSRQAAERLSELLEQWRYDERLPE